MNEPNKTNEVELVQAGAVEMLQRGEMDSQIATAKKYPRSLEQFKKRAIAMATIDEDTAESCIYRRIVGKKNGQDEYAEGMSVRMAEIVGASYGNMRVYAMITEATDRKVTARGMAIDLESNFASSSEVSSSTVTKDGNPFSERMRLVVAAATLAKARRDATFQVVPRSLAKPVEAAVRQVMTGNAESLGKRRDRAVAWIAKCGVMPVRVYRALGINGPSELDADKLIDLTGIRTAIKENEISIDEAFPEIEATISRVENPQVGASSAPTVQEAGKEPQPTRESIPQPPVTSVAEDVQKLVESAGGDFTKFQGWLKESGWHPDPTSLGNYEEVPLKVLGQILKAKKGFVDQMRKLV